MSNLVRQLRVLRHRDFRYLWLAQSASVIGDCIVIVALALFVIELTGSATDLGFVLAAASLPLVAFLLLGGVWADRLPRHRVMVVTDLVRFALHALLATLIFTDTVAIWQLIVIEALFGSAEAFFRPAANGLLPQTVPEQEIQQANGLSTLSNNIGEFAGPALATALVLGLGAGWAFALDAATFLISAALLSRVRPRRRETTARQLAPAPAPATPAPTPGLPRPRRRRGGGGSSEPSACGARSATAIARCARAAGCGRRSRPSAPPCSPAWPPGSCSARSSRASSTARSASTDSSRRCSGSARSSARCSASAGGRASRCARRCSRSCCGRRSRCSTRRGSRCTSSRPAMLLGGAGIALFDVWWMTALAERIPPDKLSRVSSYDWMVSLALLPLGYVLAGPLAGALGAVEVLLGGSVLAAIALALGLLPRQTRMLERFAA